MAKNPFPAYGLHKPSGQARVILDGKHIYLGTYDSPESKQAYWKLVDPAPVRALPKCPPGSEPESAPCLYVNELIEAYKDYAAGHYIDRDGKPTDEQASIRAAAFPLFKLYGMLPATQFGPRALKKVQRWLIDEAYARSYINDCVNRIRRMFKWAVSEELIPVTTHQALQTVPGLRRGQSQARESEPVRPVSGDDVKAVLPDLTDVVSAMVQVQELTGMRPGELCVMRAADIECDDDIWVYQPKMHKNAYRGMTRKIAIGPMARALLQPYLDRDDEYVFSPRVAVEQALAKREEARRGTKRKRGRKKATKRKRPPSARYDSCSYRRAITRACDSAKVPRWSPNQLRHTCATRIRESHGAEAAAAVLGNSLGMVVEIYAESNFKLASDVMREVG